MKTIAPDAPLEKTLRTLCDEADVPLFVNRRALEAAGIDADSRIGLPLHGGSKFGDAIQILCQEHHLGCTVDEEVLTVSTEGDISKNTTTRVYDVRDLASNPQERTS